MLSKSLQDTQSIARAVAETIIPYATGATTIALEGDLGAGKTTFTKSFAHTCGIKPEDITSPTFVIMKRYEINFRGFKELIHIDAYRLDNEHDIIKLGFMTLLKKPETIILIEWAERIKAVLPTTTRTISFRVVDENSREIGV